jgi:hypothetical protein
MVSLFLKQSLSNVVRSCLIHNYNFSASEVRVNTNTIVIVGVVLGLLAAGAIVGLVFLCYRNRRLEVAYHALRNNNIPLDSDGVQVTLELNFD